MAPEKEFKVSDEHRVNELSLCPGGGTIKVLHANGKIFSYDKIKNPRAYLSRLLVNDSSVVKVWLDESVIWENRILS